MPNAAVVAGGKVSVVSATVAPPGLTSWGRSVDLADFPGPARVVGLEANQALVACEPDDVEVIVAAGGRCWQRSPSR
jgi:hypothetical protein